jgi:hypothetical protein
LHRLVWYKFNDVSEVLAASNIKAITPWNSATSVNVYEYTLHNKPEYRRLHNTQLNWVAKPYPFSVKARFVGY